MTIHVKGRQDIFFGLGMLTAVCVEGWVEIEEVETLIRAHYMETKVQSYIKVKVRLEEIFTFLQEESQLAEKQLQEVLR